ncbi:hypothetical protein TMUPMC115_0961 [Tetragenococcus muriaticus PMC-11-5]|uniref:Uncharacterized protein n=1 Tax=Tetragenococcus muriaticus PMC-11-5 TaxID=1302649 RepID=A0A091C6D6_9ENTE|nr:hypothetical protein TMUPMC115_0961 [Tetragenococcus muriaticus PMC-11-5]
MQNGWKLEDIEEADFDLLMQVLSSKQEKKQKQKSLNDYLKNV